MWTLVGVTTGKDRIMPIITLPDGSQRSFDKAVSIHDVTADIGPGLAKAALAGRIDGELLDTSFTTSKLIHIHKMARQGAI
jgi:TGS domain